MLLRWLFLIVLLGNYILPISADGASPEPSSDLKLVFAVTNPTEKSPGTTIFTYALKSATRTEIYQGAGKSDHILVKIAGSDVIGAGRCLLPGDIYLILGPPAVPPEATSSDYLSRLRLNSLTKVWERLLPIPLSFSETSPYGLWNRAPIFAISPRADRIAFTAQRVGANKLDRPVIRVLNFEGIEEWRVPLPTGDFCVADLAWSPDGNKLAYCLLPRGDEHTLDESLRPKAGLYLADMKTHDVSPVYQCYARAIAWGMKMNRITVAVNRDDIWGPANLGLVLALPTGQKVEEFSLAGSAEALTYADSDWLAVQINQNSRQEIWLYPGGGGLGRRVYEQSQGEGRLALLGWARINSEKGMSY